MLPQKGTTREPPGKDLVWLLRKGTFVEVAAGMQLGRQVLGEHAPRGLRAVLKALVGRMWTIIRGRTIDLEIMWGSLNISIIIHIINIMIVVTYLIYIYIHIYNI